MASSWNAVDGVLSALETEVAELAQLSLPPLQVSLRLQTLQVRITRVATEMLAIAIATQRECIAAQREASSATLELLQAEDEAARSRSARLERLCSALEGARAATRG